MQANALKGKIVAAGYTQNRLAAELNMSKNTLSSKINGKTPFNANEIIRMCEVLSIVDDAEKAYIFLQ